MARINGSCTGGSASKYNIWIDWSITSQDIPNNTSTVNVKLYLQRNDGYASSAYNSNSGSCYKYTRYDSANLSEATSGIDTRNNALVLLKETNYTIAHNADGTRTVNLSGGFTLSGVSSLTGGTVSGNVTLTTIPRQANLTGADNFNDEQNPTIYYNNPAGNSVTELVACIAVAGNLGAADIAYRAVSKTSGGYTFNLTEAERNVIRSNCANANSKTVKFYLRTLIGGQYYYSTLERTASIINAAPTITGSYADQNATIVGVTGNNQLLISGLSNAQITAVPSPKKYATISSVKIGGVNVTAGGSPYRRTIEDVTATSYLLEVTDSRGLSNTYTLNLTYVTYQAITFLASFFRTAAMNNEIALQFSGTFYNHNIGSTANTLTVRYRYQPELGEWSEWITVPVAVSGNNFSNVGEQLVLGTNFDHNKQYRFEIEFIDLLDTKTNTILVRAGRHILKVTENVQVLQGKLHIQKLYTKNDKDFVFDFVYDVITRTWVVHVYGLTQLFEPQHVFQADVNTRSIVTVLNTDTYPLLKYTIDDTSNNFIDYKNVDEEAVYNNYTLLDTGISPLDNVLDKRAREFQFTTFNDSAETLEFFVSAYIDSRNVSNPSQNTIDWISDPEDPNYGQLYEIEEEIANVYGETNLDSWVIDYSNFPKIGLVKSHLRLHGKGLFYRAVIVNRDMIEHELSGVTWVYRIMNAR